MSLTDRQKKCEEHFVQSSSDSGENYLTEEEGISELSLSGSIIKLKNISIGKPRKKLRNKKHTSKNEPGKLNVSLRYGKSNRHFRTKNKSRKVFCRKIARKFLVKRNCSEKLKNSEKAIETPKKGKRCRLGGKAKGKPPKEENHDKHDIDDESDSSYFGRISLGYFQKFRDKSGASTSYQWEEDHENPFSFCSSGEKWEKTSEEKELLELQKWGVTALVSSYAKESEKLSRAEDLHPSTL